MSEFKKLLDKLGVHHDNEIPLGPMNFPVLSRQPVTILYDEDRMPLYRLTTSPSVAPRKSVATDTECFSDLFRASMREPTFVFNSYESPIQMIPTLGEYKPKVSKFGKRERNKVQVPLKEKQVVNSNSYTKKRKKRK